MKRVLVLWCILGWLSACGSGGSGNAVFDPEAEKPEPICEPAAGNGQTVAIRGAVSFERVPTTVTDEIAGYLSVVADFSAAESRPARFIRVEAVECGVVRASTLTDSQGRYQLTVPGGIGVVIRVLALVQNDLDASRWQVQVRNNTARNQPVYAYETSRLLIQDTDLTQDIHFSSGWHDGAYVHPRQAAPFAILDTLYRAMAHLEAAGVTLVFPTLSVYWSPSNRDTGTNNIERGELVSSFYRDDGIYLLGHAGTDADEFDEHVIVHEWGHFIEDHFTRSDSMGGGHYLSGLWDPRLAFSEGFANTWSALLLGNPLYSDTMGAGGNFAGSGFDIEANDHWDAFAQKGWFSEFSVQSLLYDLADEGDDDDEALGIGLPRLFGILSTEIKQESGFVTVFPVLASVVENLPDTESKLLPLLANQGISPPIDRWGGVQGNWGALGLEPGNKAVFTDITDREANVCFSELTPLFNGLARRRFFRLQMVKDRPVLFRLSSPVSESRPVLNIWQSGKLIRQLTSTSSSIERQTSPGQGMFVVEIFDQGVVKGVEPLAGLCYTLEATVF